MYYVYILMSARDGKFYIGFTSDLKRRVQQHKNGMSQSTSKRLPVNLIYYEAYSQEGDARRNEQYYKTTKGRNDLRKKLQNVLDL